MTHPSSTESRVGTSGSFSGWARGLVEGDDAHDELHLAATSSYLYEPDLTAQFDHGLRRLLDGIAMQARGLHRDPGSGERA